MITSVRLLSDSGLPSVNFTSNMRKNSLSALIRNVLYAMSPYIAISPSHDAENLVTASASGIEFLMRSAIP